MSFQPNVSLENFANIGNKKKPIEAEAVTKPVAIVLFLFEKNFPTAEIGTDIAVPPKAIPTKIPKLV